MNHIELKWMALWGATGMYAIAAVWLLVAVMRERRTFTPMMILWSAAALHTMGLLWRAAAADRLPVQNLFESLVAASLLAVVAGLFVAGWAREPIAALAGAIIGAMGLAAGALLPIPGRIVEPEAAILSTAPLLAWHVGAVLAGYAFIALGAVVGVAVLLCGRGVKEDDEVRATRLQRLDRVQMRLAQLAFLTLGAGVLLGAWWAHGAWGRWWGWDPKETWALITWCVYLVAVHLRVKPSMAGPRTAAWLSITGLVLMLWSYFGVNLLFPGLHSYAG